MFVQGSLSLAMFSAHTQLEWAHVLDFFLFHMFEAYYIVHCICAGNRAVYSAVIPRGTASNHRFPSSQQYDRRQTEHEGSSSLHAMEPSATGLQQARVLTDATLVQCRNAFVVYFHSWVWSTVLSGIELANRGNNCAPAKTAWFDGPFHPGCTCTCTCNSRWCLEFDSFLLIGIRIPQYWWSATGLLCL